MRSLLGGVHIGAAFVLFVAVACGGSEFSSQDPDASMATGSTGGGSSATTDISSVASGGSSAVGVGGTGLGGSIAGAGGAATGGGGSAGRDAGFDARGGGGAGGAGGTPMNSGDCDNTADCGGDPCVELSPGGYRVCVAKVPETTTCSIPPGQCCKSADCGSDARPPGKCVAGPVEPYCGWPAMIPTNQCASDACNSAADCSRANAS